MLIVRLPDTIPLYGDPSYRGDCPPELVEQASFFNRLRREHPKTYGLIALHPRNEGQRFMHTAIKHSAEGMAKGASDIIIPGKPSFVCELKRQDYRKSKWEDGQMEYLEAAQMAGSFVCLAFGALAAWDAFQDWLSMQTATMS